MNNYEPPVASKLDLKLLYSKQKNYSDSYKSNDETI